MNKFKPANLEVLSDKAAVAAAVAKQLVDQIAQAKSEFTIALSGGSTPKVLFNELVSNHADSVDWQRVRFFWGDERCVPPDDEQSNYKMANELLLQPLKIKSEHVFRVRGEDSPSDEAVRYASQIKEVVTANRDGLPEFDFMLLGMGADGHTASIFPHQMDLLTAESVCAVATHPESGQNRVTITGPTINAARQIVFMITGAAKAKVVDEIINLCGEWESYPTSHIGIVSEAESSESSISRDGGLRFYLDNAAAASLL